MFENGKVEEVVFAFDCLRLLVFLVIADLVFKEVVGLLLTLPENS